MANWALIIGINQYWEASRNLKGAVNDAMRMLQWLMTSTECHVPAENIFLLTRPTPAQIPNGVTHRDAIADELLQVIPQIGTISDQQEVHRFFFYFSGHGITNLESVSSGDEQCLVMADFTPILTNKAVKFHSIKDFFKATRFQEQFFFIDACRNLLEWSYKFETGSTTIKREIGIKKEPVEQFILNSTAPRTKAWEGLLEPTDNPGDERGAFTGALLDGLNGDGAAKVYDSNNDEYLVRKESLFNYVINDVEARNIWVIKDPVNPVKQRPRKDGEHSKNPVLATIPSVSVQPERLELFVVPDDVWPVAELKIGDENHEFQETFSPPVKGVPLPLPPLQPMTYTVHASAPNHILEGKNPKRRSFPLYEPTQISVRLIPVEPPAAAAVSEALKAREGDPFAMTEDPPDNDATLALDVGSKSIDDDSATTATLTETSSSTVTAEETSSELGVLVVESDDPLASLEISSNTGELLDLGHGHLELSALDPGFYRARLIAPEGQNVEELIELVPGEKETIRLDGPPSPSSRVLEDIIRKAGFLENKDNFTFDLSKAAGPVSSIRLSTILSLAAVAANQNHDWGSRLRTLQVTPFNKAIDAERPAGLQIVAGLESRKGQDSVDYLSAVGVRLWQQGVEIPEGKANLTPLPSIAGLAEFSTLARSGPHWLAVEIPNEISAVFSLYLPPRRITLLVFHRDVEGHTQIFQYVLDMHPTVISDPESVRRCELIQRFCMNGRFQNGYEFAKEQLDKEDTDSIACCVGGYLALMVHDLDRLKTAIRKLNEKCPDLSDAFVLSGGYHEWAGREDEARIAYAGALDRGIPVFANGITRLHAGLSRTGVEHPRATLLTKIMSIRFRGLLWSACSGPESLSPGRLFEEAILDSHTDESESASVDSKNAAASHS